MKTCDLLPTRENHVEHASVCRNDSSFTKEEELTGEKRERSRANAKSSSDAKHKGWKLKLIEKIVKLKCGRQLRLRNRDVTLSIKSPTNSGCRKTRFPVQYNIWSNTCSRSVWNYRVKTLTPWQLVTSSCRLARSWRSSPSNTVSYENRSGRFQKCVLV